MTTRHNRVATGLAAWVVVLVVLRLVVLQPERCGPVEVDEIRSAATAAIDWLVRNQSADGSWLYRYNAPENEDLGGYNSSRHAGVTFSLYQAAAAGLPEAWMVAEQGTAWLLERAEPAGGGVVINEPGAATVPIGPSALFLAALGERRELTGERRYDELMADLSRFLEGQVGESGFVSARWDSQAQAAVPDAVDVFFTGEAYFALARMARLFPEDGWDQTADRIAGYIINQRDEAEDIYPPVSDHWSAYALAETAERRALTEDEVGYAARIADIFGPQIRWESQRTESWFSHLTRGRQALPAGVGTLGEGAASLWRAGAAGAALEDSQAVVAERVNCVGAMLVERQVREEEAAALGDPDRTAGAWFQFGVTQMDDQQHALSALLGALAVTEDIA